MWHFAPLRLNDIFQKLKFKISVHFVTSVFSFILNIVSTNPHHDNENKLMKTDEFDHQEIKRVEQSFLCFNIFFIL